MCITFPVSAGVKTELTALCQKAAFTHSAYFYFFLCSSLRETLALSSSHIMRWWVLPQYALFFPRLNNCGLGSLGFYLLFSVYAEFSRFDLTIKMCSAWTVIQQQYCWSRLLFITSFQKHLSFLGYNMGFKSKIPIENSCISSSNSKWLWLPELMCWVISLEYNSAALDNSRIWNGHGRSLPWNNSIRLCSSKMLVSETDK